jgi:hypothetical protein
VLRAVLQEALLLAGRPVRHVPLPPEQLLRTELLLRAKLLL